MESNKTSKFNLMLRKYGYWVALAFALAVLVTVIVLAATSKATTIPQEPDNPVGGNEMNFASPVENVSLIKDYSNAALQYNKTLNLWQSHKAIDFAADEGTKVLAVMDGKVTEVTYNYLMGNIVKLDVGNGLIVVYASLTGDIPVKAGDTVTKGTVIGYVGNTAKSESSDGPHLHLEVLLDNEKVDPNLYIELSEK